MPKVSISKPVDVATRETFTFLSSHLTSGSKIIEVGCGDGEVALELARHGHDVTALDSEEERVAKALARGVHAVVASWPEFDGSAVDAIAFTRSLHHINPLDEAVKKARELLKPYGHLLIEDFAFGETDKANVEWFVELLQSEKTAIEPKEDQLIPKLLAASDPMTVWRDSHDQALHSIAMIHEEISKQFVIRETQSVPYLYRYLIPVLPEKGEAALVERVFDEEARAGKQGKIQLMGRRIIAAPK
jgi:ubiquinone/menaquinone biosynthesis C-methylase UbiE